MAAKTQARAFGAGAGRRYGSFSGKASAASGPHPVARLTQALAHGAGSGRRNGSFARSGSEFPLSVTAPLAFGGALSVTGNIGYLIGWDFTPPLTITTMAGSVAVAADLQYLTTFNLGVTLGPRMNAAATITGNLGTVINVTPGTVSFSGVAAVAGDIGFTLGEPFDVAQTAAIAAAGSVAVIGDITYEQAFNVAQSQALALTGAASVTGNILAGSDFDLVASSLGLTGAVAFPATLQMVIDDGTVRSGRPRRRRGAATAQVARGVSGRPQFLASTEEDEFAEAAEILSIVLALEEVM